LGDNNANVPSPRLAIWRVRRYIERAEKLIIKKVHAGNDGTDPNFSHKRALVLKAFASEILKKKS